MDHFHWLPEQIGRLTDRQIMELAYHKRDSQGAIIKPESVVQFKDGGLEEALKAIGFLALQFQLPPDKVAEMREQARAKFAEDKEERAGN